MRIFVSARLQATAAPDAPEPMISTSTMSLLAISGRPIVTPERSALPHGIEQRPVALFQLMAFRKRRARLHAERVQHSVVAVVALQDDATQDERRIGAGRLHRLHHRLGVLAF